MRCPVCKESMIVVEYESVEVDYCVSCEGVWLDAGELELLLGDDAEACAQIVGRGDASKVSDERPRKCPVCGKKMEKAVAAGAQPVTYDRCAQGEGLWFDKGELGALLEHRESLQGDKTVPAFLREIFSKGE